MESRWGSLTLVMDSCRTPSMVRLRTHSIACAGTTDIKRRFASSAGFIYPRGYAEISPPCTLRPRRCCRPGFDPGGLRLLVRFRVGLRFGICRPNSGRHCGTTRGAGACRRPGLRRCHRLTRRHHRGRAHPRRVRSRTHRGGCQHSCGVRRLHRSGQPTRRRWHLRRLLPQRQSLTNRC